jgi:hypothetical protein
MKQGIDIITRVHRTKPCHIPPSRQELQPAVHVAAEVAAAVEHRAVASVVPFGRHAELCLRETVWALPCRMRNLRGSTFAKS